MSDTSDIDPGAPASNEAVSADAIARANYGDPTEAAEPETEAPTALGTPATLAIDRAAAHAFLEACTTSHPRVGYGLGAKISPHGAVPGTDFRAVDCSGFVRELIWRATAPHSNFKDGSVVQHEWVRSQGFQRATVQDGALRDGRVRIAFLPPDKSPKKIGHVALVHNGMTLESHGGLGPDARPWTGRDWQASTAVYVLDARAEG